MLNLERTISSAAVGVASGAVQGSATPPLSLGGMTLHYSLLLELAAFLGGAAVQMLSPMTMPGIVDGVIDGGAALLGARGTLAVMKKSPTGMGYIGGGQANPLLTAGYRSAPSFARGQIGNVSGVPKRTLT